MRPTYISLGHRCHIAEIMKLNEIRDVAFPFDNIISSFAGVIHCFTTGFFEFMNPLQCDILPVGRQDSSADSEGNRKLFRNRFFAFTHYDMQEVFERRISRLHEFLLNAKCVVFLRSVLDEGEEELYASFASIIRMLYPSLIWKLVFVYDHKDMPECVYYRRDYFVANSPMETVDENRTTHPQKYRAIFRFLSTNDLWGELLLEDAGNRIFSNDSYKGWAILDGIMPFVCP